MLDQIDESIEAFFDSAMDLGPAGVDISFEAPDRVWSAKLSRPTLNIFLWDIRRSTARARAGVEEVERNGERIRRMPLPTIELRYLITAWTSDHGDERALLSGAMRTILKYSAIPEEHLSTDQRSLRPPAIMMARTGEEHIDVFRALEGQLKPSISMVLVTDVDTGLGQPIELKLAGRVAPNVAAMSRRVLGEAPGAIGATVRAPRDLTRVDASGFFRIDAEPGELITLDTDPPQTQIVPPSNTVRFP
jgi:hypothetical protein